VPLRKLAPAALVAVAALRAGAASPPPAAWATYLDAVERSMADARSPERLRELSDGLRARRDEALAAGPVDPGTVRRSAALVARLETLLVAWEHPPPPSARPPVDPEGPLIVLDDDRAPAHGEPAYDDSPPDARPAVDLTPHAFTWPVDEVRPTSRFGARLDPITGAWAFHAGVDLAGPRGAPVRAAGPGRVVFAGWRDDGCGYTVVLRHGDDLRTEYCHLASVDVAAGDVVAAGHRLGGIGATGRATGNHLHWTARRNGRAFDPTDLLGRRSHALAESKDD
jgi:murein DD-endopeptidase MepM/ murein hydrolase activator NlpD